MTVFPAVSSTPLRHWPCLLLILALLPKGAFAGEVTVAVAANFLPVLKTLARDFSETSGHRLRISAGSTGKLYAQIRHGAPFDLFLAADAARPERLEREGHSVPGSRFTYAIGRLVLWSPRPGLFDDGQAWLRRGRFGRLALANPKTAPYGLAARQFLQRRDLWTTLQGRLIRGESVAQAFQFVMTGNADAGFVALAQVRTRSNTGGSLWTVPDEDYEPLEQQAVLLKRGDRKPAARAFHAWLRSESARERIHAAGYALPEPD